MSKLRELKDEAKKLLADKGAPRDHEAERTTIGAVFREPACFTELSLIVSAEDFYDVRHRAIFAAMKAISDRGEEPDQYAVASEIGEKRFLEFGGSKYLIELTDAVLSSVFGVQAAKDVRLAAARRLTAQILVDSLREVFSKDCDPAEFIGSLEQRLASVSIASRNIQASKLGDVIKDVLADIGARKGGQQAGVEIGFSEIDNTIGGLAPSTFTILAARPSVGKTSMAMNIGEHVGLSKKAVAFFSLEMGKNELGERHVAGHAGVESSKLKRGVYSAEDMSSLVESWNLLSDAEVYILDCPGAKLSTIVSMSRRLVQQSSAPGRSPLSLIIIDYLQLIDSEERGANRVEQVSTISRRLKLLAVELKVPVIALSQLSRAVETRGGRPRLSDLRESGSLEQDADMVFLLSRVDPADKEARDYFNGNVGEDKVLLDVAKNRNGPTPAAYLQFVEQRARFYSIDRWRTNPSDGDF